ncbi:unnamed protein product, partial [Vitis vinifera]|uniref:Uncharacterized protein n=1 Tax=Vitis vinifera TaxID=29760 RepID=D7U3R5_VITVI
MFLEGFGIFQLWAVAVGFGEASGCYYNSTAPHGLLASLGLGLSSIKSIEIKINSYLQIILKRKTCKFIRIISIEIDFYYLVRWQWLMINLLPQVENYYLSITHLGKMRECERRRVCCFSWRSRLKRGRLPTHKLTYLLYFHVINHFL